MTEAFLQALHQKKQRRLINKKFKNCFNECKISKQNNFNFLPSDTWYNLTSS